jgi:hypothetical protein
MSEIKGSCRCGHVTYESAAEPIFTGICHCQSCQKRSGGAFSTVIAVPGPSLTVSGPTKRFESVGDSGNPTHYDFCPDCGTAIKLEANVMPGVIMLPVGTLDDPSWVRPAMQIYCDSAQPWVSLGGAMQCFPKMPA